MRANLRSLLVLASRVGANPADSDDLRLHKSLMVLGAAMTITAGALWGGLYAAYGEPLAAAIPLLYAVISAGSLAVFAATGRYHLFRFSQLFLILLLPFALMFALGGFIPSSAVILWSFLCPLGAIVFDDARRAPRWFAVFALFVVLSGLLAPFLRQGNHLPPGLVLFLFGMNITAVCGISFVLLYTFVQQKEQLLALLREEQQKSENLLLNILPEDIAAILKHENRTIAEHYDGASILFADMVNFTPLTAALAPTEMVELLNAVFTQFDALVDHYQVEKIRTIGDSYMVAAGVPRPRRDHAHALAHLALDMRRYIATNPECLRRQLDFRIGINSGPVVAGVIGRKKFIYDLWGDAVNTASRMESHGTPGKIHITRATYELIKDDFACEPRGLVPVKGKGEMETFYLSGLRASVHQQAGLRPDVPEHTLGSSRAAPPAAFPAAEGGVS